MPWLDPARQDESAEDRELRAELRGLVGLPISSFESNFFEATPTPDMVKLAENLRAESLRRRNTARRRPLWMLMAAGLPVALLVSGLGVWGIQQKQKADVLAAAAAAEKTKVERAEQSSQAGIARDREGRAANGKAPVKPVIKPEDSTPVDPSPRLASNKGHRATGTTTFTPSKPGRASEYPVIEVKQTLSLPPPVGERVKAQ